jgi:hypothetical protein
MINPETSVSLYYQYNYLNLFKSDTSNLLHVNNPLDLEYPIHEILSNVSLNLICTMVRNELLEGRQAH